MLRHWLNQPISCFFLVEGPDGLWERCLCQRVTPITCTVAPCVLCCWPNHLIHVTITRLTHNGFILTRPVGVVSCCWDCLLPQMIIGQTMWCLICPITDLHHFLTHLPTSTWYPSSPIQWCLNVHANSVLRWTRCDCWGWQSPMICVKPLPETSRHIVMQAWLPPSTTRMELQAGFFRFFVAPQYVQDRRIEAISFASNSK